MPLENAGALEAPLETLAPVETVDVPNEPVADQTPPSMDDSLRAKFRELAKAEETPPVAKVEKTGERARGPDGKFIKTEEEKAADVAAAAVATPVEDEVAKAAEAAKVVAPEADKAPTSWKKEAQAKWTALDPEIKAEVLRREADIHKGIEGYREKAQIGELFDKEFRPYEAMIRAAGITPQELTKNWLNTEYQLKTGSPEQKAAMFVDYAGHYGITQEQVNAVFERVASGQPAVEQPHPEVLALKQEIEQLKGTFESQKTETARREFDAVRSEVDAFKKDHPHFELVKLDMNALIQGGRADGLKDAYDKAIYANPAVRALVLAEQQAAERKQAADKAAAAKKASATNVTTRGTLPPKPVVGTMDDTLRAKLKEINGE